MDFGLTDFGSTDNSNYYNSLNAYQSSLNIAHGEVAKAQKAAQDKVDQFNQALEQPLQFIGAPLIAKSAEDVLDKIRANLSKKVGEVKTELGDRLRSQTGEVVDTSKAQASRLSNSASSNARELVSTANDSVESGVRLPSNPLRSIQETDLDRLISQRGEAQDAVNAGRINEIPDATHFDRIFGAKEELDQFRPELIPSGQSGRVELSQPINVEDSVNQAVSNLAENQSSSLTDGASSAINNTIKDSAVKAGADADDAIKTGLKTASVISDDAAASQGGLDPIADIGALGVGLALTFSGLFGKRHAPTIDPPAAINAAQSFGV